MIELSSGIANWNSERWALEWRLTSLFPYDWNERFHPGDSREAYSRQLFYPRQWRFIFMVLSLWKKNDKWQGPNTQTKCQKRPKTTYRSCQNSKQAWNWKPHFVTLVRISFLCLEVLIASPSMNDWKMWLTTCYYSAFANKTTLSFTWGISTLAKTM